MMVPLDFLLAMPLAGLAIALAVDPWRPARPNWLICFLMAFAAFLILIGVRFGYGMEFIGRFQSYLAIMLPPLGLLAFRNPPLSWRLLAHALPIGGLVIAEFTLPGVRDAYLGGVTLSYSALLALDGLKSGETLAWAPMRHERILTLGLWASVGMLMLSGVTDVMIAIDVLFSGGTNIPSIVERTSLVAVMCIAVCSLALAYRFKKESTGEDKTGDQMLVDAVGAMLIEGEIYRDPDLTLKRIARRAGTTERKLSGAINRRTGGNLSQFVNRFRIEAAMSDLAQSDISVTSVMLASGFLTKSNFNREFKRVTGKTPTIWRKTRT